MTYKQSMLVLLLFSTDALTGYALYLGNAPIPEKKEIFQVKKMENTTMICVKIVEASFKPIIKEDNFELVLRESVKVIMKFENFFTKAYHDPRTGNLPITIGYGSTLNEKGDKFHMGETITKERASNLLTLQLKKEYIPMISKVPYWNTMSNGQKVALISFGYNLGKSFYGHTKFHTISQTLVEKKWNKVPAVFELYSNPKSNVHKGLLQRRKKEGAIWAMKI